MSERERKITLTHQIVARVDSNLYNALSADATAHGRTVAQSVRFILSQRFAGDSRDR